MTTTDMHVETVACDLCGETDADEVFIGRDLLHGVPGQWPVVRCKKCGLVRVNPRPSLEELGRVYPYNYSPYRPKKRTKIKTKHRLFRWAWRHHWDYPADVTPTLLGKIFSWPVFIWSRMLWRNFDVFPWHGEGRLLDVGCGGGAYLLRMRQFGWRVQGMDFSERAVNVCREQDLDVRQGVNVEKLYEPKSFDVVTLWHVLEHVPSPTQTLMQIRHVLTDEGLLVLAVPNFDSWCARRYKALWFGMELPRHIWHFTSATLEAVLEKNGFFVERRVYPKYGQTIQNTMNYIAREKNDRQAELLGRSKRLCMMVDMIERLRGTGPILVVHARKKN
ncbi:MAG: class I SAM-dependent methyltransferase [Sedimentisphaerales bacterium]|nr:class I SAM-dependent methyltransferase [Sedimentisphaerales bacterium]